VVVITTIKTYLITMISNLKMVSDKLLDKIDKKRNPCVVGLDPIVEKLPRQLLKGNSTEDVALAFKNFNFEIIDAIHDLVPAVKPQVAFYEKYSYEGFKTFKETVDYAKSKGLIVIEDGKRNDIGSTSEAYAQGHLGKVKTLSSKKSSLDLDLLTVNPYLGTDGLTPFIKVCEEYNKGIFILVKTSNPSSGELQDRYTQITDTERSELSRLGLNIDNNQTQLYNLVALQVNKYAQKIKGKRGYSSIGAVVGATYPEQAKTLRKIMPDSIFLVPGYGAQGGDAKDLTNCFNDDGYGAIVNSSRGIIFAYEKHNEPEKFAEHARKATISMIEDICSALESCDKLPSSWKQSHL
jgi:orotidine-5'-phosphate decarboxylase